MKTSNATKKLLKWINDMNTVYTRCMKTLNDNLNAEDVLMNECLEEEYRESFNYNAFFALVEINEILNEIIQGN